MSAQLIANKTGGWITAGAFALVAGLNAGGCASDGTTTGTVGTGISLAIQGTFPGETAAARIDLLNLGAVAAPATAASATLDVTDASGTVIGTITLVDARVALKEIKLERDGEDGAFDDEQEAKYPGPYVVDLLTDTVTPSLDTVTFPAGTYNQIKLKLDKIEGDEDDEGGTSIVAKSDPLFGNSIYVEGTYTGQAAGGTVTDAVFKMSFDLDEEIELAAPGETSAGFTLGDGQVIPVVIAFRLAQWLDFANPETNSDSVDFNDVTLSSGNIVLDKDSNGDTAKVREVVKKNIEQSAEYGKDDDGDGKLEGDEDDHENENENEDEASD